MIKIGKLQSHKVIDEATYEDTTENVVEKTNESYIEILLCIELREMYMNGSVVSEERNSDYKVYCNKTLDEILALNNIPNNYTWSEPLTQIS